MGVSENQNFSMITEHFNLYLHVHYPGCTDLGLKFANYYLV